MEEKYSGTGIAKLKYYLHLQKLQLYYQNNH